jgi:hypothetical protein
LLGVTAMFLSAKGHLLGVFLAIPLLMLGIIGVHSLLKDTHRDTLAWESWVIDLTPLLMFGISVVLWLSRRSGSEGKSSASNPSP